MGHARPTIERRQLGAEIRRLREAQRKSQKDLAAVIECDTSSVSKIERGTRPLKAIELSALLELLGVEEPRRTGLMELGVEARKRQPRRPYADVLPGAFRRIGNLEEDAAEILYSEGDVVPGLLQTEAYMRAIIRVAMSALSEVGAGEVEARVQFRKERQELLDRDDPPRMWFVVGEPALRRPIGGTEVMRDQLQHLLDLIGRYPNITVQVVPLGASDHPLLGGAVCIYRFGGAVADVVHQPSSFGGGVYEDDKERVALFLRVFDKLRAVALGPDQSRAWIAQCAKEIER